MVSTFAGEESYFGCPTLDEGWAEVRRVIEPSTGPVRDQFSTRTDLSCMLIASLPQILFLPSFFVEPAALSGLRSLDGAFNVRGYRQTGGLSELMGEVFAVERRLAHPAQRTVVPSRHRAGEARLRPSIRSPLGDTQPRLWFEPRAVPAPQPKPWP